MNRLLTVCNRSTARTPGAIGYRRGFTLVELLIAMTITLLLMAALGKSFAVIGRTMKEGRSKVTLSGKLRSLSYRVRSDLRNRTTEARPRLIGSKEAGGYITYYEGPLTEHTWGMFGAEPTRNDDGVAVGASAAGFATLENNPTYRKYSRHGDFDDYIAYTAKAPGDSWFTGKVPRYLVDDSVNVPTLDTVAAMEPTVIRSKYAEIIIWAEPEYQIDPATKLLVFSPATGMPVYRDDNNDYIPDSVTLHQRILLIRPDLNLRGSLALTPTFESEFLRPLAGNAAAPASVPEPLDRIYPIGNPYLASPAVPYNPSYAHPLSDTDASLVFASNWLVGMAPLHQFFDISLRRIIHPVTGEPTPFVAANSLEDLVEPHNRFGHVRYPGRYFGYGSFGTPGTDSVTSMPLLATAWNPSILQWNSPDARAAGSVPTWFPSGYPNLTTQNAGLRTPLFNGFLIPHFTLGDPNPMDTASDHWQRGYLVDVDNRWDRTGEDVLTNNILAFDIKAFDANAPVMMTVGLDDAPGKSGVDDDGNGTADVSVIIGTAPNAQVLSELGAVGSDDVMVRVGDLSIYPLMSEDYLDPRNANFYTSADLATRHNQMLVSTGDYVDLFYPYLAGGPLLDLAQQVGPFPTTPFLSPVPSPPLTTAKSNFDSLLLSPFSGYPVEVGVLSSLKRSGKLVHGGGGVGYRYFQPCFDTWTSGYESDGFDQTASSTGAVIGTAGTIWVLYDSIAGIPGRNARLPTPVALPAMFTVDTSQHDPTEPECLPPVLSPLSSINLTIRLEDPISQEMSQVSVIENLID